MHWADKIAKEIIASKKFKPYWVDDMKTPSGYAHVGSLRGPIIHSLLYRALRDAGEEVKITFVFNDFDPADEFPPEFKDELSEHAGKPLKTVPSPDKKYQNLADLLADDLKETMKKVGVEAEFLSSWKMYREGKFDGVIKTALDNAEKIQDIYQKISGSRKKEQGWLPFQVVCEKCGKLGTTRVFAWDGKEVSYRCEEHLVTWAKGCGHEGKISPFGGTGKLPWKVDWPAHWKVIGVTIEGAGKDHASAGGAYDIAMTLCKEVFDYPQPYKLPYEFLLIGGKKMSSSKGLGLKAHDIVEILPAEIARFLFVRSDYREQANFDPDNSMAIPDLFDEYDECWQAYIKNTNKDLTRIYELSQIDGKKARPQRLSARLPMTGTVGQASDGGRKIFLPRFRDVANYLQQPNVNLQKKFADMKGSFLTKEESEILEERIKYAKIWLEKYAPDEAKFKIITKSLTYAIKISKEFLKELIEITNESKSPEELEKKFYALIQKEGRPAKEVFPQLYNILINKPYGPKLAWLIWENKEKALTRLKEASK